ncbi:MULTISPECIES: hypothetical protein [unclassified Spirillospora]|uniref:hypothetical protein n=1 Tax=unclassified Spirillospora TaxID=2642701 RepID=UPI00370FF2A2
MTADDTRPDLPAVPPEFGPPESEETPEPEETRESRLRPLDRRVLQAIALLCAVPAILALHWVDETNNIEKNLKPPETVTTVPPGKVGELVGARWMILKRATAQPRPGGAEPGSNGVTELRLTVGVRPGDAASAKTVGSYGLAFRFVDDEGREWTAVKAGGQEPRAGTAMLVTVKGTVPRAKADSLDLEIRAPKTSRKEGEPLPSLRFEH